MKPGTPNPQGKGLIPVLDRVLSVRTSVTLSPKPLSQVSNELFTSLFILESRFAFRPVAKREYWLYRTHAGEFRLSLVSPAEARGGFGAYIGACTLHDDLTWTLRLSEAAAGDRAFLALVEKRRRALEETLASADNLAAALPYHVDTLPFQQRVFAAALAHSLGRSLALAGLDQLSLKAASRLEATKRD